MRACRGFATFGEGQHEDHRGEHQISGSELVWNKARGIGEVPGEIHIAVGHSRMDYAEECERGENETVDDGLS